MEPHGSHIVIPRFLCFFLDKIIQWSGNGGSSKGYADTKNGKERLHRIPAGQPAVSCGCCFCVVFVAFVTRGERGKLYLCHGDALDEQPGGGSGTRRAQELLQGVCAPLRPLFMGAESCEKSESFVATFGRKLGKFLMYRDRIGGFN